MKTVGHIEPEINNDGECVNPDYVNGKIVALTSKEVSILKMLQEASEGNGWGWRRTDDFHRIKDGEISDALQCVYAYVKARFMINDLQGGVNHLLNLLTDIESEKK